MVVGFDFEVVVHPVEDIQYRLEGRVVLSCERNSF